jgi:hypothetical protein
LLRCRCRSEPLSWLCCGGSGGDSARRGRAWAVRDCARRLRSWRFTRERFERGRDGGQMLIGRELRKECAAKADEADARGGLAAIGLDERGVSWMQQWGL